VHLYDTADAVVMANNAGAAPNGPTWNIGQHLSGLFTLMFAARITPA
jgi:hypothetical protein